MRGARAALAALWGGLLASSLAAQTAKPQSVRALVQLAETQSKAGDLKGALATTERALILAPNAESILASFARLSMADHAPRPAVRALEALARMHPGVAAYHHQLGEALTALGDLSAAIPSLKRAEELTPNDTAVLVALGAALNGRDLYSESRPCLVHALELEPDSVDAAAALAEAEAGLGDLAAAESHAERALLRSPAHAAANLVLGSVRLKQERYAEARDLLEKAATADPASAKAHERLASAYAALGDDVAARKERAAAARPHP